MSLRVRSQSPLNSRLRCLVAHLFREESQNRMATVPLSSPDDLIA